MPAAQNLRAKLGIHWRLLKIFPQAREKRATIGRIVNEPLIAQHCIDRVVEFVLPEKLIVIEEGNCEARWHDESSRSRMNQLAKIRGLCTVGNDRRCAL